jgi:hypothetical protein
MMLTCPRCGHTFETRATTNTRCRRCRFVVRVPRPRADKVAARRVGPQSHVATRPTSDEDDAATGGGGLVVAVALLVMVAALVNALRARRNRGKPAPLPLINDGKPEALGDELADDPE